MADIKKVILSKKIDNTLYRIYPKTSADIVEYNDEYTVGGYLAYLADALQNTATTEGIDSKIESAIEEANTALYNKIMGLTDENTTINEAYDTLKEVADYLTEHGDVVTGIQSDISSLQSSVQALEDAIAALDYSKVEASTTNGNIVIDGTETTVYTLPDTLPASMIETDDDHQFVTAAEKAAIDSASTAAEAAQTTADAATTVTVVSDESEVSADDLDDNDIVIILIDETE